MGKAAAARPGQEGLVAAGGRTLRQADGGKGFHKAAAGKAVLGRGRMANRTGTIVSLQTCPGHREPMQFKAAVRAVANLGLAGDRHARPNSPRQVLLVDEETLRQFDLPPGMVRENITTRGIELRTLKAGARLRLGDVLVEITKPCTPCGRMDEIREGLRQALQGQRGMLARVIEGGTLRLGDVIEVI
jgi:hypothetical protein